MDIRDAEHLFDGLEDLVDFTRDGLGRDLLANQAVRISDRAAAEEGTDGEWDENRGEYGERKREQGLPVGVGIGEPGEDRMLSMQNLLGEQEITPTAARMSLGTSEFANRKAQWFSNGSEGSDGEPSGATNQPARPFYGFTEADADAIVGEIADAIGRRIRGVP